MVKLLKALGIVVAVCCGPIWLMVTIGRCSGPGAGPGAQGAPGTEAPTPRLAAADPAQPVIEVAAEQLTQAYAENEVAADNRYRRRRLRIAGTVDSVSRDIADDVVVTLRARGLGVAARMSPAAADRVAALRRGQLIAITCECRGATMGAPSLWGCTF